MKTLVIVESPGKLKTISSILGENYKVIASYGHIRDLSSNKNKGMGINVLNNFKPYFAVMENKIDVLQNIIDNVENSDEIILASDADREGESISWHIYECIKEFNKPIKRASFNELTKETILQSIQNAKEIDMDLVKSQICRRILDRLVGFMVSPLLMNHYSKKLEAGKLSAGRVQSSATKMIIERERDIKKFVPKEYWNLTIKLNKEQIFFAKYQGKIKNETEANSIKKEIESNNSFNVNSIISKSKYDPAPPPLTTAKMQQVMATKYGFDGEKTMQSAQSLYEMGYCTYIRTDSVRVSDKAILSVRGWLEKNDFEIPKKPNQFQNKENAADAHEAIRPTNLEHKHDTIPVSSDDKLLYKTIWEHFIASQMMPAVYDTLEVKIEHHPSKHIFKAGGKALKYEGYLAILGNKETSKIDIPNLKENQKLQLVDDKSIHLEQKYTQPPARYNYATIIKELEHKGIGRPSTFAGIIGKITDRHYVNKDGNTFYGTLLGDQINTILDKYFAFMDYNYTSKLEQDLDDIALGKKTSSEILTTFFTEFKEALNSAHTDNGGKLCSNCNFPTYQRIGTNNKEYSICVNKPFCAGFTAPKN